MALVTGPLVLARVRRATAGAAPRCVWGPVPILNNAYWSRAVAAEGVESRTLMRDFYAAINARADFDLYVPEVAAEAHPVLRRVLGRRLFDAATPYLALAFALERFDVFHYPASGGFLSETPLWRLEAPLLHMAGKRIVVIPYGADNYMYSRVRDPSLQHALLISYPGGAPREPRIERRLRYWVRHADFYAAGSGFDGQARWDVVPINFVTIDTRLWSARTQYSSADGRSGPVTVLHTPNHRGVKGTEFLIQAVEELQRAGLQIDLVLLERVPNAEVRRVMRERADILAEQFIASAYGLSAIEGLATGLPVMGNLADERHTRVSRRYGYLNECPILSTTPETLKANLRVLVTKPSLRQTLGEAGRAYAEKYHSPAFAQYLFGKIYDKIWYGKDVDLLNLFHPLTSEYSRRLPKIEHPLVENRLPPEYMEHA